jgi:hypothetical protein
LLSPARAPEVGERRRVGGKKGFSSTKRAGCSGSNSPFGDISLRTSRIRGPRPARSATSGSPIESFAPACARQYVSRLYPVDLRINPDPPPPGRSPRGGPRRGPRRRPRRRARRRRRGPRRRARRRPGHERGLCRTWKSADCTSASSRHLYRGGAGGEDFLQSLPRTDSPFPETLPLDGLKNPSIRSGAPPVPEPGRAGVGCRGASGTPAEGSGIPVEDLLPPGAVPGRRAPPRATSFLSESL